MEFVLIPPIETTAEKHTGRYPGNAKFRIGSPTNEFGRCFDEGDNPNKVELSPFLVAKTETTQKQWDIIKAKAGLGDDRNWAGENLPIENVSWDDCQNFITKLNNLARSFLETAGNSRVNDDAGVKYRQILPSNRSTMGIFLKNWNNNSVLF